MGVTAKTNTNAESKPSTKIAMGLHMPFSPAGPAGQGDQPLLRDASRFAKAPIDSTHIWWRCRPWLTSAWYLDMAPSHKIFPAPSLLAFNICAVHTHRHFKALASHHRLTLHFNIWREQISHYAFGIRKISFCLELVGQMTSWYESQTLQSNA